MTHIFDLLTGPSGKPSSLNDKGQNEVAGQEDITADHPLALFAGVFSEVINHQHDDNVDVAKKHETGPAGNQISVSLSTRPETTPISFSIPEPEILDISPVSNPESTAESALSDTPVVAVPSPDTEVENFRLVPVAVDTPEQLAITDAQIPREVTAIRDLGSDAKPTGLTDNTIRSSRDSDLPTNTTPLMMSKNTIEPIQFAPTEKIQEIIATMIPENTKSQVDTVEKLNTPIEQLHFVDLDADEARALTDRLSIKQGGSSPVTTVLPLAPVMDLSVTPPSYLATNEVTQTTFSTLQNGSTPTFQTSTQFTQNPVAQVAQALATVNATGNRMEIMLDPPELGRVYIDFNFDGDRIVNAVISAEQSDTTGLMRKSTEVLIRELSNAGFDDVTLSFSDQADQRFEQSDDRAGSLSLHTEESELAQVAAPFPAAVFAQSENAGIDLRL